MAASALIGIKPGTDAQPLIDLTTSWVPAPAKLHLMP